jgi:hypothetical protein
MAGIRDPGSGKKSSLIWILDPGVRDTDSQILEIPDPDPQNLTLATICNGNSTNQQSGILQPGEIQCQIRCQPVDNRGEILRVQRLSVLKNILFRYNFPKRHEK